MTACMVQLSLFLFSWDPGGFKTQYVVPCNVYYFDTSSKVVGDMVSGLNFETLLYTFSCVLIDSLLRLIQGFLKMIRCWWKVIRCWRKMIGWGWFKMMGGGLVENDRRVVKKLQRVCWG